MNRKRGIAIAVGLVAVLAVGGLYASNMGFKLNYPLDAAGTNGSAFGNNSLGLPFNQQTNLLNAFDLIQDINASAGASVVVQVGRFDKALNTFALYTGTSGTAFRPARGSAGATGAATVRSPSNSRPGPRTAVAMRRKTGAATSPP